MRILFLFVFFIHIQFVWSQEIDTARLLQEVVVRGYANDRTLSEIPASIGIIEKQTLERFSNTSLLPAVNIIPGVRMEERSPGSYRFSIRGSSLRSPFGVRNVKFYWNGIPFTDGGGNTYLNLIDFHSVSAIEIIKGPGSSLYGAGTGGVVLLKSPLPKQTGVQAGYVMGSFGLQRYHLDMQFASAKTNAVVQYAHQEAEGYREQTAMQRDALMANINFALAPRSTLTATVLLSDLSYETPGGLTRQQYNDNPQQARPATATLPGAVEQQASVNNKTIFGGLSHEYQWNDQWITRSNLYYSFTDFQNPAIRNYETRKEHNSGGRVETQYTVVKSEWKGKLTFGTEIQAFSSPIYVYNNNGGINTGEIQSADKVRSSLGLLFLQGEIDLPRNFFLTLGSSVGFLSYQYASLNPPLVNQNRKFDPVFSPRIAILKKIDQIISAYGSISSGFSPPSLAEVRPSTGTYNNNLNPERGISYEVGVRGKLFKKQFHYDITGYSFALEETIVIQRDIDGAEYFINAGATSQKGIETFIGWNPFLPSEGRFSTVKLWSTIALHHYRFKNYVQDGVTYSGNELTGVAPSTYTVGFDVEMKNGLYSNLTYSYTDQIPLNDSNTEHATSYCLLNARLGCHFNLWKQFTIDFFGGVDNILDERYSLGNDLNAVGGRFYNAASPKNFYLGITVSWKNFKRA